jgi:hypothetical protein
LRPLSDWCHNESRTVFQLANMVLLDREPQWG